MKFIVSGQSISSASNKVVKAISSRTTNPILECIKLKVVGNDLTLSATDNEISIEKTIEVETFLEGETLVPGKLFDEFVKRIESEQEVGFELIDNELIVSYGASDFSFQTLDPEEFPIPKKDLNEYYVTLKQIDFCDIVRKTTFACSLNAQSRKRVDACYIEVEDDYISAVGSDNGRLAINKKPIIEKSGIFDFLILPRTLNEIVRIMDKPNSDDIITLIVQDSLIMCSVDGTTLISTLVDGDYIDYKNIFRNTYKCEIYVEKEKLLKSLDRATLVISELNKIVKFEVEEDKIRVLTRSDKGKVSEVVTAENKGIDIEISFYAKNIIESLKAIDDEFIVIKADTVSKPIEIKPVEGDEFMHFITPLRKQI